MFAFADLVAVHHDDEVDEPVALVRGRVVARNLVASGGQVIDDELPDDLWIRAKRDPWAVSPLAESLLLPEPPFLPFRPGLEQEGVEGLRLGLALGLVGQSSLVFGFKSASSLLSRRCSLLSDSFASFRDVIGETSHLFDSGFRHLS